MLRKASARQVGENASAQVRARTWVFVSWYKLLCGSSNMIVRVKKWLTQETSQLDKVRLIVAEQKRSQIVDATMR